MLAVVPGTELEEQEQSRLRVIMAGIVLIVLVGYVWLDHWDKIDVLWVAVGFLIFSVVLMLRLRVAPPISVSRRFLGMIADNAVTTFCLIRMGEDGSLVLGVYLFIIFGNGFRFGRIYLHACQLLGIAGFSLVWLLQPFWSQHVFIFWLFRWSSCLAILREWLCRTHQRSAETR